MNMFGVGRRSHLDYWRRGERRERGEMELVAMMYGRVSGASAQQQILDVRAMWPLTISPQRKCCS